MTQWLMKCRSGEPGETGGGELGCGGVVFLFLNIYIMFKVRIGGCLLLFVFLVCLVFSFPLNCVCLEWELGELGGCFVFFWFQHDIWKGELGCFFCFFVGCWKASVGVFSFFFLIPPRPRPFCRGICLRIHAVIACFPQADARCARLILGQEEQYKVQKLGTLVILLVVSSDR